MTYSKTNTGYHILSNSKIFSMSNRLDTAVKNFTKLNKNNDTNKKH